METVATRLTPRLAKEVDRLVADGWFANRSEALRAAVRDLVDRARLQRLERAVNEDAVWGRGRDVSVRGATRKR